jgi:class 3 adenylate cyclase
MSNASDQLSGWLARVIRYGRTPAMPPSEARYVVLTNIVALLGVLFTLGFAPVLLLSGSWLYPALQLAYALVYLPTLWLNRRGHHSAATTWLMLGSQLVVISQVLVEGFGFDVEMFFFLHAALPFMVCAPQQTRRMLVLSGLACMDLFSLSALKHHLPQLGPVIAPERLRLLRPILIGGLFATLASCAYYARRATLIAEAALDLAHARSEELLLNILPSSIADRLKLSGGTIADGFAEVTVLFADIVGFTTLSSRLPPARIVEMLNALFCSFDDLAGQLGLEKIKTIGDCYMVAGGLPEPRGDHAEAVAEMALGMLRIVAEFGANAGEPLQVRIGIHSGPVVAGVIGKRKFIYDLWGDTVNIASRMESHGLPGAAQVSEASQRLLDSRYRCTDRRTIEVKGKGRMDAWLLGPRRDGAETARS